ncbi:hypothetical protein EAH77_15640 [Ewingella americana]|uniref:Calcineurin-like phosphoesterase domain-containing protein n=2 Tax=Ewingella americana TaxID=41202 RepID=A0A502GEN2_9GAMM|nr:hypothetical protein EAH77_15640 [Ewingella americana]
MWNVKGWLDGEKLRYMGCADIHIGALRNDMGEDAAIERANQAFYEFLTEVDRYQPHIVFIIGDVYMHKMVTDGERRCWNDFLASLLKRCLVVLQPGNHDFLSRTMTTIDNLQIFTKDRLIDNLIMTSYDSQLIKFSPENAPDKSFTVLNCPCLTPLALNEVAQANVVLFHGNVRGAIMDNGFVMPEESDHRMTLPLKMADLFLLGDIHKRQWVSDNALYTAAMYQTKFSEDTDKGYIRGHFSLTEDGKFDWFVEHVDLVTPYQLHTVLVNSDEEWPEDWDQYSQHYVRVIKDINVKTKPQLPSFVIKEVFSGSFKSDMYNNEVDVDIQSSENGLHSVEFLENQFGGAEDFLNHLQETSDFELTPEEKDLALAELAEIRSTLGI